MEEEANGAAQQEQALAVSTRDGRSNNYQHRENNKLHRCYAMIPNRKACQYTTQASKERPTMHRVDRDLKRLPLLPSPPPFRSLYCGRLKG